jgi:hypothetical protein
MRSTEQERRAAVCSRSTGPASFAVINYLDFSSVATSSSIKIRLHPVRRKSNMHPSPR